MADSSVNATNDQRKVKGLVLGETLGKGTFGFVKLGTKVETGHKFALKFLKRDVKNFQEKQIKTEIECMKRIQHKHVVALLASAMKCKYPKAEGGFENCVLMVLEYANGGDLYDIIYYGGAMSEKLGRTYFKQLLDGLEAIHAAGITHRDLKPNNILIDHKYNLKITDFGLSHIADKGVDPAQKRMKTSWVGTRGYRAPELILKARYSNQTDVFALGVCLFVMLCARQPFKEASADDPWYKCIATQAWGKYWRSHKSSKLTDDAKDILQGLLAYQPRQRLTLKDAKEHKWMQQEMEENLIETMREIHRRANQGKFNDPSRAERLQASAPGFKRRGDGNKYSRQDIPMLEVLPAGYVGWELNKDIEAAEAFVFVLDCLSQFIQAKYKENGDYSATVSIAAALNNKGRLKCTFNIRLLEILPKGSKDTTRVLCYRFMESDDFIMTETAVETILDACARKQWATKLYEEKAEFVEYTDVYFDEEDNFVVLEVAASEDVTAA